MLARTFDTFDIILAPSNYGELAGAAFLLLPLLYIRNYWVSAPTRTWPHLTGLMIGLINRTSAHKVAGLAPLLLVFWNFLLPLNEFGLIPFRFPVSSHISMTLAVRILLWGSIVLLGLRSSYSFTISHFLPRNVGVLGPFIILVEIVRSLVRPLTLAFRLAANITAGHVILSLAAVLASNIMWSGNILGVLVPSLYYAFEVVISWVQAYVFLLLLIFYSNDYLAC